ncbi:MBL fold metallo-hydrolase [Bdellovibrio reynosensis]|uniref:MBL fold metallo-hydrolase n=1 Tax=Bdellovibrio reynosensis TaxID=2835041 RepID=A0ABY4CBX7_9BACT|nr:MBL fold metallo-hydrolase [Bdellovibrio reynosensis]UOF02450.1 MBL fold metallo-hydrolase [Bdellovibrio reynosensis]
MKETNGLKALFVLFVFVGSSSFAANKISANQETKIEFSIVRTGTAKTQEALVIQGGAISKKMTLNHSAFLIRHGNDVILLDTGLGKNIDQQFKKDMPVWAKPFFSYEETKAAIDQIPAELKEKIKKIYLTHVHWDHASGLEDFLPGVCVSVPDEEMKELTDRRAAATFPSQFSHADLKWCNFNWSNKAYRGFDQSYDVFGDGTVVAVPLPGHSIGSMGVFVHTKTKDYFLVGDLVWSARAIELGKHKFFVASKIVDRNREKVMEAIEKVREVAKKDKSLIIIPAHDAEVQDTLGYFPKWIQ